MELHVIDQEGGVRVLVEEAKQIRHLRAALAEEVPQLLGHALDILASDDPASRLRTHGRIEQWASLRMQAACKQQQRRLQGACACGMLTRRSQHGV